ncbi:MAG: SMI1/KNR4 family protein [Hymenobacter sp.]|nr:MAG: SMI1/KNR4 family protein [Hymenobacter sp.]
MNLKAQLKEILLQIDRIGGDARPLILSSPTEEQAIQLVEQKLGYQLPTSFRSVLSVISCKCEFSWFLPDDLELPYALRQIFSGQLE